MATTADIRNGMCIEYNDQLYTIVQFQHVKPGKGPAFVRTKLKNITTGRTNEVTFTAGHKINETRVERRPYQFLYKDDLGYHFMHRETYEQISITEELINNVNLLKEGGEVEMVVHADTETPLYAELSPTVVMEITYTEPGVRGDTSSTSSLKQATIETGATIMVPLFCNQGDKIRINTVDNSYMERVKE
ncbi:MAG: elongation factor P [Bacteroidales bacterium]|jgi:elongation factor P|nr:elongation factor P [Bacteroidales bacterium]MDD2812834.1 elongation factor P [Bacteroidales bacterium]MDD3386121.1 elongation factor P [Bacteroidales bacterium]MDD3811342.1 elongation factor P [Bacteroidales bacterium]MDD3872061.1 elongation factor P [Bacteroidales bacterium]